MAQPDTKPKQIPRYKVLAICHINDKLLDPALQPIDTQAEYVDGAETPLRPLIIAYEGIPGPHLEPVNDAAREMCEKYKDRMIPINPVNDLPVAGPGASVTSAEVMANAMVAALKSQGIFKAA